MDALPMQFTKDYAPNRTNFQLVYTKPAITGGRKAFDLDDYISQKQLATTQKENSRFNILKNKIDAELNQYSSYIEIDIQRAKSNMFDLAEKLADIPFQKVSVEITPSNAVKFKMILDESKLLIINKPFEELLDLSNDEIIFSIFVNRELIISNAGTTFNVVEAIQKYMSM